MDYANASSIVHLNLTRPLYPKVMEYANASSNVNPVALSSQPEIFYRIEEGTCASKQDLDDLPLTLAHALHANLALALTLTLTLTLTQDLYDSSTEIEMLRDAVHAQLILQYIAFFTAFCVTGLAIANDYKSMHIDTGSPTPTPTPAPNQSMHIDTGICIYTHEHAHRHRGGRRPPAQRASRALRLRRAVQAGQDDLPHPLLRRSAALPRHA